MLFWNANLKADFLGMQFWNANLGPQKANIIIFMSLSILGDWLS